MNKNLSTILCLLSTLLFLLTIYNLNESSNLEKFSEKKCNKKCSRGLSLKCPHAGCDVEEVDGEFVCPCHGSRFSLKGKLLEGPAESDLEPCGCKN